MLLQQSGGTDKRVAIPANTTGTVRPDLSELHDDMISSRPIQQPHTAIYQTKWANEDAVTEVPAAEILGAHDLDMSISMAWTDAGDDNCMDVCAVPFINEDDVDDPDGEDNMVVARRKTLPNDLAFWAVKKRISQEAIRELLALLTYHDVPALPKDPRTLMKTPRSIKVKTISRGHYYHFGIYDSVRSAVIKDDLPLFEDCVLELQLNIDGLPTTKSSNDQLWPILGRVTLKKLSRTYRSGVFVIALFFGESKPASAKEYLDEFVDEYLDLRSSSFLMCDVNVEIVITSVMTDAPANAFVKCIKAHGGYNSCPKCEVSGDSVNGRVVYPGVRGRLRTDDSFNTSTAHRSLREESPFVRAGIGMITAFPVDYMHALIIGLMKKLILLWLFLVNAMKMDKDWRSFMSERLLSYRDTCPTEFARRPRSLKLLDRWKATELRSFLCYTGVAVTRGLIKSEAYEHFLLLVCATRLLVHPRHCQEYNSFAADMLRKFVAKFASLYGRKYMSYNAHVVVHLPEDVALHGNLDTISSFPYESYLHDVRQMIRKPGSTLVQVVKRLYESRMFQLPTPDPRYSRARCQGQHALGPVPPSVQYDATVKQYEVVVLGGVRYTLKGRDSVVYASNVGVGHIVNMYEIAGGAMTAVLVLYKDQSDLFSAPMPSSGVGIHRVNNLAKTDYTSVPLRACTKVWLMPMSSYSIAVEVISCME